MHSPRDRRALTRGGTALIGLALVLLSASACGSSKPAAAAAPAKSSTSAIRPNPTAPGAKSPCRAAMDDLMAAGGKITGDGADKAKAAADLQAVSSQLGADAGKVVDPASQKAVRQLSDLYHSLADSAKNNKAPDVTNVQSQVQTNVAILGKCTSAGG